MKEFSASELTTKSLLEFTSRTLPARMGDAALLASFHRVPCFHGPVDLVAQRVSGVEVFVEVNGERNDEHEANRLIESPNDQMTWGQFLYTSMVHREVIGEWIWVWLINEDTGLPEMIPVPPTWCKRTEEGWWEITLQTKWLLPPEMVIWEKCPDATDPMGRGRGKGHVVVDEIEIDEYAAQLIKAEFYNYARPAMVIRMKGAGREKRQKFKEDFYQKFRGVEGRGKPLVIGGDEDIEFQEVSRSLADAMAEGMRRLSGETIDSVWNIPPEWRGKLDSSNRATITMSEIVGNMNIVVPRAEVVVGVLNREVAPLFGDNVAFAYVDPVPTNTELLLEYTARHPGDLLVNERRELFAGLPPLVDGNVRERPVGTEVLADEVEAQPVKFLGVEREVVPPELKDVVVLFSDYQRKGPDEDADRILRALAPRHLADETGPAFVQEFEIVAEQTALQLGRAGLMSAIPAFALEAAELHTGERIEGITETTKEQLRGVIVRGLELGKAPKAIKDDIIAVFGAISEGRAVTIARTEMLTASNAAKYDVFQLAEVKRLEWVATTDERTRDSHRAMDGQIVTLGKEFVSGAGYTAHRPGGFSVAQENVNCRCTIEAVIAEQGRSSDQRRAIEKAFSDELDESTERFLEAVRRGLARQQVAIEESIDNVLGTRAA